MRCTTKVIRDACIAAAAALCCACATGVGAAGPVRALVVTGGHEYPTSFYTVFEQDDLAWDHAVSNEEALGRDLRRRYDALVLYDTAEELSNAGRQHFQNFVENGGGVVALHHAIVSYPGWTWYRELLGGQYLQQPAGDRPALDIPARSGSRRASLLRTRLREA